MVRGNVVGPEYTHADTNSILPGRCPVELLHPAVTNERGVESGEVISGDDDGNTGIFLLVVHSRELHVGGVVGDVHQSGVHHLVVDGVLGGAAQPSGSGIQIVDEEDAHFPLVDDVRCLTISLPDQFRWLSCISALQFSGAHHNRAAD